MCFFSYHENFINIDVSFQLNTQKEEEEEEEETYANNELPRSVQ